jgi:hypothetical protein
MAYVGSGVQWKPSVKEPSTWTSAEGKLVAVHPTHRLQVATVAYTKKLAAYNARHPGR